MISWLINASSSNGSWGSSSWQAPARGTIVGLQLDIGCVLNGAGADVTIIGGVYEQQPAGTGGFTGNVQCWAFAYVVANEPTSANGPGHVSKSIYVPVQIEMVPQKLIWLGCFNSSAVHSAAANLVLQFKPKVL